MAAMTTERKGAGPDQAPAEDHRVRVGRQRSEKMRRHLLQSVLEVCSGRSAGSAPVIDDVIRHADVARGTFYKHFDSLEQAMSVLAVQLGDEMTQGILSVYDVLEDPVMRTATGFQMFLIRAMIEPQWGAFITHIGLLSSDNLLTRKITDDIRLGVETGDYDVPSVGIASDVLMGAKIEAIQRLIAGSGSKAYAQGVASMVLRSFGVAPAKAEKSVARAWDRFHELAPGKIAWWRAIP
jgi:AcrR family transcriptional regulator